MVARECLRTGVGGRQTPTCVMRILLKNPESRSGQLGSQLEICRVRKSLFTRTYDERNGDPPPPHYKRALREMKAQTAKSRQGFWLHKQVCCG